MASSEVNILNGGEDSLRAVFIETMDEVFKNHRAFQREITYTLDSYKEDGTRRLIVYLKSGGYLAFTLVRPLLVDEMESIAKDILAWSLLSSPLEVKDVRKQGKRWN